MTWLLRIRACLQYAVVFGVVGGVGRQSVTAAEPVIKGVARAIEATGKIIGAAKAVERVVPNLGFYDSGACLFGTTLQPQEVRPITCFFEAGTDYLLFGGGDNNARDVDILVFDDNGERVKSDMAADDHPVVHFNPDRSGNYTVQLKLFRAKAPGQDCYCVLVMMEAGGWSVPVDNLATSLANFVKLSIAVDLMETQEVALTPKGWSLHGGIQRPGTATTLEGFQLEPGRHIYISAGDSHVGDLDNEVLAGSVRIGSDTGPDAIPTSQFSTHGERLTMKTSLLRATGPAFIVSGVLHVR